MGEFKDFDVRLFDDPEFKEDAVREEIVTPLLHRLGYSPNGPHQIVRGRQLTHPYTMIGSQRRKVSIVPDYVCIVEGHPLLILDAKRPSEALMGSDHASQAYSYAIHPDIRAIMYALCNGRQLVVWDVTQFEPVLSVDFSQFDRAWTEIARVLSPDAVRNPITRGFLPDLGMSLMKAGYDKGLRVVFGSVEVDMIAKVNDDWFSVTGTMTGTDFNDGRPTKYAVTFDFDVGLFENLMNLFPSEVSLEVRRRLAWVPFRAEVSSLAVAIVAYLEKTVRNSNEEFGLFLATRVEALTSDPRKVAELAEEGS